MASVTCLLRQLALALAATRATPALSDLENTRIIFKSRASSQNSSLAPNRLQAFLLGVRHRFPPSATERTVDPTSVTAKAYLSKVQTERQVEVTLRALAPRNLSSCQQIISRWFPVGIAFSLVQHLSGDLSGFNGNGQSDAGTQENLARTV